MTGEKLNKFDLHLLNNADIFEKINSQTDLCVRLFTEIGNAFPQDKLLIFHHGSKGIKISKGNKLNNKPYQVLDLFRDFDPLTGFNIRILNWWGVGMFCFVLYGVKTAMEKQNQIHELLDDFTICEVKDKWNYAELVHLRQPECQDLNIHLNQFGHCQLVKRLALEETFEIMKSRILESIHHILNHHLR
jgi:hypothetical protein